VKEVVAAAAVEGSGLLDYYFLTLAEAVVAQEIAPPPA